MISYGGQLHHEMQPTSLYHYNVIPLKGTNHSYRNMAPLEVDWAFTVSDVWWSASPVWQSNGVFYPLVKLQLIEHGFVRSRVCWKYWWQYDTWLQIIRLSQIRLEALKQKCSNTLLEGRLLKVLTDWGGSNERCYWVLACMTKSFGAWLILGL